MILNGCLNRDLKRFEILPNKFSLLILQINNNASDPSLRRCVFSGECPEKTGLVVYCTNRCPFTEYHVCNSLVNIAKNKHIPPKVIKLETMEQAQNAPSGHYIYSPL